MAKPQTKAQQILGEASFRLRAAEAEVTLAREALYAAEAAAQAHRDSYQALEAALAPTPRATPKKKASSPSTAKGKESPGNGSLEGV